MATPIVPVPDTVLAAEFPSNADREAGLWNQKAKDWANSENAMVTRTREIALTAHNNATAATEQAVIATTKANEAAGSAQSASEDAQATAADRVQTGLDAQATAEDRVQTGLDRVATAADRVQTGIDRQAVADGLASIADGPVFRVNTKTGDVTLTATDIAPAATEAEMEAGEEAGYRSMSPALVAHAVAALVPDTSAGDHCVIVNTGNGYGTTNTAIRRFTTTQKIIGTAITYADSATLGSSFTINEPGLYEIYYIDSYNGSTSVSYGISLNASNQSSNISSIPDAERVGFTSSPPVGQRPVGLTRIMRLVAGDVIRPHADSPYPDMTQPAYTVFSIQKVGI